MTSVFWSILDANAYAHRGVVRALRTEGPSGRHVEDMLRMGPAGVERRPRGGARALARSGSVSDDDEHC